MLSKCLNPRCSATFRYLRQGRLYRVDFSEAQRKGALAGGIDPAPARSRVDSIEHFWLCEGCAATLTIEVSEGSEVRLVPLEVSARTPAAASAPPLGGLLADAS